MEKGLKYKTLYKKLEGLLEGETDEIAVMANTAALIKEEMGFFWVGFYIVRHGELVLGPFQGPDACTHIGFGKGVCGTAWKEAETQVVPDVDLFPGHIACSSLSRSEIVVPVFKDGAVYAVLDIDSTEKGTFGAEDKAGLERIVSLI